MTQSNRLNRAFSMLAAAALAGMSLISQAQTFPAQKIQIIVPYSPANGLDLLGREYAGALQQELAVAVPVENREGAAGLIGTLAAARAAADGYTLLFTANPPFATSPSSLDKPPYNPLASFTPVARVGSVPLVLVTSARNPIDSLESLKRHVAAHPDQASYASAGIGSPGQIFGELVNHASGMGLREIPYKSTTQALTDVISSNVLVSLVSVTAAKQHIQSGALRALAVGSPSRLSDFPSVPTLAEALGQRDFVAAVWYGFFVPAGTPQPVVQQLYAAIAKVSTSSRVTGFMSRANMVQELQDPAQFAASLRRDVTTSSALVIKAKGKS